ncbi:hypothetical protein T484DRAFT_1756950 [Baffinella frigidus]|nr:hypothetical protein T484DRAFT_1756950 [Cryptophyta sp. CCMP2293]
MDDTTMHAVDLNTDATEHTSSIPLVYISQETADTTHAASQLKSVSTDKAVSPRITNKPEIKALVDAAILASAHANKCGNEARASFGAYTATLATAHETPETAAATKACGIEARRAFDAYTIARKDSHDAAAISDAAILEMAHDIERRTEALAARQ